MFHVNLNVFLANEYKRHMECTPLQRTSHIVECIKS